MMVYHFGPVRYYSDVQLHYETSNMYLPKYMYIPKSAHQCELKGYRWAGDLSLLIS